MCWASVFHYGLLGRNGSSNRPIFSGIAGVGLYIKFLNPYRYVGVGLSWPRPKFLWALVAEQQERDARASPNLITTNYLLYYSSSVSIIPRISSYSAFVNNPPASIFACR